jgi:3-hydroxyacyl-[acyl-carrier-protein] dehydratase
MSQILGITEIQELIPQRYPFLMVDRVQLEEDTTELTAIKNVTTNEIQFMGHFPGNPIMPGVLQLEAVLQAGTIAFKRHRPLQRSESIILKEVKKVRFKNPIIPGDQVIISTKIDNITDDSCEVKASCKVNGKLNSQSHIVIAYLDETLLIPKSFTTEFKAEELTQDTGEVFGVNEIASYIPHRFPFQFIDTVIYSQDDRIIGEKLVSANEPFATSFTSKAPFMPNIMLLETIAQVGCVKLLSQDIHKGKIGLFLAIENCIIHRPAVPGDKLTFDVSFLFFKASMGKAAGKIYCGNEVVAEMQIAFALAKPGV